MFTFFISSNEIKFDSAAMTVFNFHISVHTRALDESCMFLISWQH